MTTTAFYKGIQNAVEYGATEAEARRFMMWEAAKDGCKVRFLSTYSAKVLQELRLFLAGNKTWMRIAKRQPQELSEIEEKDAIKAILTGALEETK